MSEFAEQLKQAQKSPAITANEFNAGNHFELPAGEPQIAENPALAPKAAAVEPEAPKANEPAKEEAPKKQYRLAGKMFDSQDEALAYAEELAIQSREEEAALAAIKAAQEANKPQAPVKTLEDEVEEILFENPKEAIKKLREGIKAELARENNEARKQQDLVTHQKKVWDDFYSELADKHPDVGWNRELAEFYTAKVQNQIMDIPIPKAQELIASKMREAFKMSKEKGAKVTELTNTSGVVASPSSPVAQQTEKTQESPALDFISQVRKMNKSR